MDQSKWGEAYAFEAVGGGISETFVDGKKIVPQKGRERGSVYLSVYDPTEGGRYSIESKYAGLRMRCNYSSRKEKRPYSIEFQEKETKEEVDVKLLGLRSDGDWILDAVATDVARVRNRICTDIWNDMYTLSYIDKEPNAR